MTGISFVTGGHGQVTHPSQPISVTVPAGTQQGDMLLMFITSSDTIVTPSGVTLWRTDNDPNVVSVSQVQTYYKALGAADSNTIIDWNLSTSGSFAWAWAIYRYVGAIPYAAAWADSGSTRTSTFTAPSVSAPAGAQILRYFSIETTQQAGTLTLGSGLTLREDQAGCVTLADSSQVSAGPSGTATATFSATEFWGALTVALAPLNTAPNAPTVQVASTIDSGAPNVIAAPFSDPDTGDTCSQTDFQWWDLDSTGARVGTVHTQTVTGAQPTQWTAPAGTFTNGDKEIQAQSYDALGTPSGWGPSAFFTAATPTGMPTITDPTNGATIGQTPYTVAWSTAGGQKGYQVRRVKDNAGAADATTVYWNSGQVTDANARSLSVPFETNNRYEHVQVSVTADGSLWSSWADARVNVSYTAPAAPTFSVDLDAASGSALITITNPAPGTGQPSSSYNVVETDDGDGKGFTTRPGSSQVTPNTSWRYWTPPSGFDPAGNVRVTAVATNGVTASTTSPLNVTDGNSPANTTTTISDGGVVL